jgi:Tfp pilus assembly protein PilO
MNKLSQREKKLVGFLLVVVASIPFFLITMPAWKEYSSLKSQIVSDEIQASALKNQLGSERDLIEENRILEKKLRIRKAFLAQDSEIDFLVQDLKNICDESSVSLESFTPTEVEPVNIILEKQLLSEIQGPSRKTVANARQRQNDSLQVDLYRYPIEIKTTGKYTDIIEMFKKLEKYGRVISIDNLSLGKIQTKKNLGRDARFNKAKKQKNLNSSDGTLTLSFDLLAYSLAPENKVLPFVSLQRSAKQSLRIETRQSR